MLGGLWDQAKEDIFNFWRLRKLKRYLKRCYRWCKFLWVEEIEEWDNTYIFKVWAFELEQIRHSLEAGSRHTCWERNCRLIKIAELLLKRIAREEYTTPKLDGWILDDISYDFYAPGGIEPTYKGVILDTKGAFFYRRHVRRNEEHEKYMRQQDIRLLCDILAKHSGKWWD